jgi:hypothetical protein
LYGGRTKPIAASPDFSDFSLTKSVRVATGWLERRREGGQVRLVDSAYEEEAALARVREVYPSAWDFEVEPMSLREIFVTLARHGRANGKGRP